jgi:hypothetical protein
MPIVEQLERTLAAFPNASPDPEELVRLQRFFNEMKDAGVARTREYDLPRPDTIGRAVVAKHGKAT